jgi:hypothetical protein
MPTSSENDYAHIDIDQVLKSRGQVAIVWSIEDVQGLRPDLNNDQAWEVIRLCKHWHDFDVGFTRLLIEEMADELFPRPKCNKATE